MNINFENLDKIDDILKLLNTVLVNQQNLTPKKWLSVRELSEYLDYSTDRIHKLKNVEFLEGIHYHKRAGKLLFDKELIDKWVIGIDTRSVNNTVDIEDSVNKILESLAVS